MLSLCVLGVVLRFHSLDFKVFSNDETFSLTTIFGHSLGEIQARQVMTVEALQAYQKVDPQVPLLQSFQRILTEPYVFPPLYSILMEVWARFWNQFLTSPATITRSLSVVFGVLCLPSAYWLSYELFASRRAAWITAAVFAVSPFHLQYAQIVRTYSLTTLSALLASTLLLRAIRLNNRTSWALYSVSAAIALYSNLLCGFLLIAHTLFVIWLERFNLSSIVKAFVVSVAAAGATFLPWFILFITKPGLLGYSVEQVLVDTSLSDLLKRWLRVVCLIFSDFNNPWVASTAVLHPFQQLSFVIILGMSIGSVFLLLRQAPRAVRLFLISLVLCTGLSLMFKDVLVGGTFSTRPRYMIPSVIAIQLIVIFGISSELASLTRWRRQLAVLSLSILLGSGLLSSLVISKAQSWSAFGAPDYPMMAEVINRSNHPVVLFEDFGDALTLSYLLRPDIHIHLNRSPKTSLVVEKGQLYNQFETIYFFKPGAESVAGLQKSDTLTFEKTMRTQGSPSQPDLWLVSLK